MLANELECNIGKIMGQVDLAMIKDDGIVNSNFYYGNGTYNWENIGISELSGVNTQQFQLYGIEWNAKSLEIFVNDRVIYQANPYDDQYGKEFKNVETNLYLPFQHPFNLLLHIGVGSLKKEDEENDKEFPTWDLKHFEIDYVRVYGDSLVGIRNESQLNSDNSLVNILIITIVFLIILALIFVFGLIMFFKRKNKALEMEIKAKDYDDIDLAKDYYEEINDKEDQEINLAQNHYEDIDNYDYATIKYYVPETSNKLAQSDDYLEIVN